MINYYPPGYGFGNAYGPSSWPNQSKSNGMYALQILADVPYPQNVGLLADLRCPNLGRRRRLDGLQKIGGCQTLVWIRIWIERVG
jgi:hypothetical protein